MLVIKIIEHGHEKKKKKEAVWRFELSLLIIPQLLSSNMMMRWFFWFFINLNAGDIVYNASNN